jgi:PLP dependent protein
MYADRLAQRLPGVRERIAKAALRAGREPEASRIVAVTKGHPVEALRAALDAGLTELGENRVGELEHKWTELSGEPRVSWHMVGHVQSRKAPRVREMGAFLHSLDSVKLARRLERTAPDGVEPLRVLVQVNTSGEDAKYGFSPDAFRTAFEEILGLSSLRVEGLMTMAPFTAREQVLRDTFRRLRELNQEARETHPGYSGQELSMGMTNDYELAVEEGSTLVRLGTALFGERPE